MGYNSEVNNVRLSSPLNNEIAIAWTNAMRFCALFNTISFIHLYQCDGRVIFNKEVLYAVEPRLRLKKLETNPDLLAQQHSA